MDNKKHELEKINMNSNVSEKTKFMIRSDLEFKAEDYLWLVRYLAFHLSKKCGVKSIYYDLIQEGCFGLMYAYRKYDPAKGYKFSSYAKNWVLSFMQKFIFKNNLMPKSYTHMYYKNKEEYKDDNKLQVLSLDYFYESKKEADTNHSWNDPTFISTVSLLESDNNSIDVVKKTFLKIVQDTIKEKLEKILNFKEKMVIYYKYFKEMSFSEIGTQLNMTKQASFCFEKQALKKLKADKEIQNLYPIYLELLYD